jgi:hypothetical protein
MNALTGSIRQYLPVVRLMDSTIPLQSLWIQENRLMSATNTNQDSRRLGKPIPHPHCPQQLSLIFLLRMR